MERGDSWPLNDDADLPENDGYLRPSEVAKLLHVSAQTVSRWANEGKIRCQITLGGHRRFPRSEVARLQQEQRDAQYR
jgi:excisionase family DNA binding protein